MAVRATPDNSRGPAAPTVEPASPSRDQQVAPSRVPTGGPAAMRQLQRTAGNRAVTSIVGRIHRNTLQRVKVSEATVGETLYNQSGAGGTAAAKHYSIKPQYQMTRNGDSGVTVTVRVKFLNQARNGTDPTAPGAPPGTPALGALMGSPTEIPVTDPDNRRAWCQNIVKEQVKPWNGRLTLVGEEWNATEANTKKRLPVTFDAVAVFGLAEEADNQVIVHPTTVVAGSPGQPIDAGNYYLNKGGYKADEKVIAAHEYGHLIGIPDEYSQSNEQMNALLHQASPGDAPSSRAALDRKTVERMVLSSLRQPLYDRLGTQMPAVADAIRAKRALVKTRMALAARSGVVAPAVRTELTNQLTAASEPGLAPSIPRAVAFQTTANFSNVTNAGVGVEAGFSAAALTSQIRDMYWKALLGAQNAVVAVKGLGDVSINVQGSVNRTTAAGGAQQAPAAGLAASTVGSPGGPATVFGFPLILPPSGLVGQLMALPTTFATAGSALETGVTPATFTTKMESVLKSAAAAAAAAPLPPGVAPPAKMARSGELYRRAYTLVTNASREASKQLATDLINTVVQPVLASSVKTLETTIETEVNRVMTTPPSGVAALGPADPNMAALVAAMKARLDANKTASAGGGRDPLGTGKPAPAQDVTYSYQGLMGTHGTMAVRADQFAPIVNQFNDKLTTFFEKDFTAEVK
jgi:hypothetical protein